MRGLILALLLATALAGCKPETARPVPAEGPPSGPTISSGTESPPPADADTDEEQMSPEKARETVHETVVRDKGVLKILGVEGEGGKTADVLSTGGDFSEEEMEALEEALGTLENKPPPPLHTP
ncbi:MAG: hypothetical protein JRG91_13685 [Deltaproteobacteria bacterium]|nr:hypothetical protein [Deltaproteobacteria bacterium]